MRQIQLTPAQESLWKSLINYTELELEKHGLMDVPIIREGYYIAGGSVANILSTRKFDFGDSDVDVFFRQNPKPVLDAHDTPVTRATTEDIQSPRGFSLGSITDIKNPIVTNNAFTVFGSKGTVQLITRFCGDPEEVMSTFDLTCCECIATREGIFVSDRYSPEVLVNRENLSVVTCNRFLKYKKRANEEPDCPELRFLLEELITAPEGSIRTYYGTGIASPADSINAAVTVDPRIVDAVADVIRRCIVGNARIEYFCSCLNRQQLVQVAGQPESCVESVVALSTHQEYTIVTSNTLQNAQKILDVRRAEMLQAYPEYFV